MFPEIVHCKFPVIFVVGITQEKINEMRAAPEQAMVDDISEMIARGEDLNIIDAQGVSLVSHICIVFTAGMQAGHVVGPIYLQDTL